MGKKITVYRISLAVIVLAIATVFGVWSLQDRKEVPKVKAVIEKTPEPLATKAPEIAQEVTTQSVEVKNPIDFDAYWALNPDVYAYIYIENTKVDYPILQHPTDNSYYLDYNMDGTKGYPGCIYTEKENAKDFSNPNTILYGHNMRNGSMFHTLHDFEKVDFFQNNKYIYIYLPTQVLQYKIFAAYTFSDRHILNAYNFYDQTEYQRYLDSIFQNKKANLDTSVPVTTNDQMITLSTCTGNDSTRWLVQAVLLHRFDCVYKTSTMAQYPTGEAIVMTGAKLAD